jgi:uncharacterized membrane protein
VRALLVVHVVLAIFLIGPLVAAANQVARSLRGGSGDTLRLLARTITIYGWASLLVALFGFGLVRDEFSFSDGWLIASIVLFVVASVLVLGLLAPMLRRAVGTTTGTITGTTAGTAGPPAAGTPAAGTPAAGTAAAGTPAAGTAAGGTEPGGTAALAPRAAVVGGIASLCYVAIAVLMAWKPGG